MFSYLQGGEPIRLRLSERKIIREHPPNPLQTSYFKNKLLSFIFLLFTPDKQFVSGSMQKLRDSLQKKKKDNLNISFHSHFLLQGETLRGWGGSI